jgi:hypothetical protein
MSTDGDDQLDRLLPLMRARDEGRKDGEIAGSLATLEPFMQQLEGAGPGDNVRLDLHAAIRDLVRRYGAEAIERAAQQRTPIVRSHVASVIAELASAETVPIDMRGLEPATPNSPADVGGQGEPGGWTGGLTSPPAEKPRGKRTRREDSR